MSQKSAASQTQQQPPKAQLLLRLHSGIDAARSPVPVRRPAITAIAATPDGGGLVVGSQSGVFLRSWDGETKRSLATEPDNVHQLAFSPDGARLAVAGGTPGEFGTVDIWSWPETKLLRSLDGHDDLVYDCVWLTRGKLLATAGADRLVRIWDTESGDEQARLAGHSGPVLSLAVSSDGTLLCSSSADQTIRVWNAMTWQLERSMTNHLGPVHALAFRDTMDAAADSRPSYLASAGGDGTVRIWQPETGRMVRIIRIPSPVHCLTWERAGRLFCGAEDGHVREIAADGTIVRDESATSGWLTSLVVARRSNGAEPHLVIGDSLGAIRVSKIH